MNKLPELLYQHIASHHIKQLELAWLKISPNSEEIISVGGAWQHYFQRLPVSGDSISDICEPLLGMLPFTKDFELPQMQLSEGQYTDISAVKDEECDWLLFCDVTEHTKQLQQYQQASNDLVLLKGELNRTLDRYVGHHVAERVAQGKLQLNLAGERREVSTLFVDIRGFTPFNESHDAQIVMQTLNEYMDGMLAPVLSKDGMVDKIIGDGAMALFGVLDSKYSNAQAAFFAAQDMLKNIATLNKHRQQQGLVQLGIGIGIATGDAVLGMLGSHDRRCFTAIGRHVNVAARLESKACAGEILVDLETYRRLENSDEFVLRRLFLKGIGEVDGYAYGFSK